MFSTSDRRARISDKTISSYTCRTISRSGCPAIAGQTRGRVRFGPIGRSRGKDVSTESGRKVGRGSSQSLLRGPRRPKVSRLCRVRPVDGGCSTETGAGDTGRVSSKEPKSDTPALIALITCTRTLLCTRVCVRLRFVCSARLTDDARDRVVSCSAAAAKAGCLSAKLTLRRNRHESTIKRDAAPTLSTDGLGWATGKIFADAVFLPFRLPAAPNLTVRPGSRIYQTPSVRSRERKHQNGSFGGI